MICNQKHTTSLLNFAVQILIKFNTHKTFHHSALWRQKAVISDTYRVFTNIIFCGSAFLHCGP